VWKVVILAGVPQMGNMTIAIEARRWLERVHHVYFITKKPYSDYLTQLATQGALAVSMADAEGRITGRPGDAAVHAGPGFLNSLISVATAYKDVSPPLLISGPSREGWPASILDSVSLSGISLGR